MFRVDQENINSCRTMCFFFKLLSNKTSIPIQPPPVKIMCFKEIDPGLSPKLHHLELCTELHFGANGKKTSPPQRAGLGPGGIILLYHNLTCLEDDGIPKSEGYN